MSRMSSFAMGFSPFSASVALRINANLEKSVSEMLSNLPGESQSVSICLLRRLYLYDSAIPGGMMSSILFDTPLMGLAVIWSFTSVFNLMRISSKRCLESSAEFGLRNVSIGVMQWWLSCPIFIGLEKVKIPGTIPFYDPKEILCARATSTLFTKIYLNVGFVQCKINVKRFSLIIIYGFTLLHILHDIVEDNNRK